MAACDIQCAWYQYYATEAFVNPREMLSAWMPCYRDLLNGGKQPMAVAPAFAPRSIEDLAHMQIRQESAMKGLGAAEDRKSTRLNSSHSQISYAVFCLKKKKSSSNTPARMIYI